MAQGYDALTEREKQTLRLLLAGHDAKSMARQLGLSVHTVNERLRDARRKFAVSSSKEAARLLRQSEAPQSLGDEAFGAAAPAAVVQRPGQPATKPSTTRVAAWAIGGTAMISSLVVLLALASPTQMSSPAREPPAAAAPAAESAVTAAAREWLALVDAANWPESWAATGSTFRAQNTVDAWRTASERARVPLGRVVSRTLVDVQDVPAPPQGYRMVRFRTDFANRRGATETLSLDREGDAWKVVGIYIE